MEMKTLEDFDAIRNVKIKDILSNKKVPTYKGCKFFYDDDCTGFFIKDNIVYDASDDLDIDCMERLPGMSTKKDLIVGFVQNGKLYSNADDDSRLIMFNNESLDFPFSFSCLSLLEKNWINKLKNGTLIFKDQTPEVTVKFKKSDPNPPGLGFTYIKNRNVWHKSGSILIHDKTDKKSYLLGQDEGQYFGVELPVNPKNIDEAIESLKPKEIRKIKSQRQGEWFLVPVEEKEVPKEVDAFVVGTIVCLPIDDEDSNKHTIEGDIHVSKNGTFYAINGCVSHEEHMPVYFEEWVKFVKNTAVRSVSVDGVD